MNTDGTVEPAEMMNICRSISGWMDEDELIWVFERAREVPSGGIWVELGSWKGRSLLAAGLGLPDGCQLWGVDHFRGCSGWEPKEGEDPARECLANLNRLQRLRPGLRCGIIVGDVTEAAERFAPESVTSVFIDASHDFDSVTSQVRAWKGKVTPSGWLCGHDYNRQEWPDVTRAVVSALPGVESGPRSIWIWDKKGFPILPSPDVTLSVIIPTIGRDSLRSTLESIRTQELLPGDEVLLITDGPKSDAVERMWQESRLPGRLIELSDGPHNDWGAAARTAGGLAARGTRLLWQDDDDTYLPGVFPVIRRECSQAPDSFLLFRMVYPNGWLVWRDHQVTCGNVSTQIFVAPRNLHQGAWGPRYHGDFDYISSSIQRNPLTPVRFVDCPITMYSRPVDPG